MEIQVSYRIKLMNHLFNTKLWGLFLIAIPSFFWPFVNKYLTSDIGYIKWLGVAMAVDLCTGMAKVWKQEGTYKAIKSRGIRDTVLKAIQYGAFMIITHIVTHFEVNGEIVNNFTWIDKMACEFLMLIEAKSVYENIIVINPSVDFIKFVVDKVTSYNKKS